MGRELLIVRHAKSDWDSAAGSDFERPLAERGRRDAPRLGAWLGAEGLMPDQVLCSPARRASETLAAVERGLGARLAPARFDERIYEASLGDLLDLLAGCPAGRARVLLLGHNPGLDRLLAHLCAERLPYTRQGKLMTTAALAQVALPDDWRALGEGCGTLRRLVRPKDLPAPRSA